VTNQLFKHALPNNLLVSTSQCFSGCTAVTFNYASTTLHEGKTKAHKMRDTGKHCSGGD